MKYPLIIKFSLAFLLFIIPFTIWGQYYDSVEKKYYYRFVSHSDPKPILKYSDKHNGKTDSVSFCGLVVNENSAALKNVRCEISKESDSTKTILFTDENGKFQAKFICDTYAIALENGLYMSYKITKIKFNDVKFAEFEFLMQLAQGTIISKFCCKRPMSRKRIDKIQKNLDQKAMETILE